MTTFYLNGCINNNDDAIRYFEERYFTVEKLVDADNDFQTSLNRLLSENPEDIISESEFLHLLDSVKMNYNKLLQLSEQAMKNKIPAAENDYSLDRAYVILLETYNQCCRNEYAEMIDVLENQNDESDKTFNALFNSASSKLNEKIDLFYKSVESFAGKNDIEINFSDE
jgi:endonuclease III